MRSSAVLLAVAGVLGAGFAACDGRSALEQPVGAAGTTGTGAAGTGAAGTGVAGTGVAGAGAAGTGLVFTGAAGAGPVLMGAAGTGVFDAGAPDAPPIVIQDAATGTCGDLVTTPPPGTFASLSAGNQATCGLRADGSMSCWGLREFSALPVFSGRYKDVSLQFPICAVRTTGEIECAGSPAHELGQPPAGAFEQVVTAETGGCARRADQTVTCWNAHAMYAPARKFETLTGGAYHMCGLEAVTHRIVCWEPRQGEESLVVIDGPFAEVDTGRFFACGLRASGTILCWDLTGVLPGTISYSHAVPLGVYHGLSLGETHGCALRDDGQVVCWGDERYKNYSPPPGTILKSVAPGSLHTCGLVPDGTVRCWGETPFCTG